MLDMKDLLMLCVEKRASDLHITEKEPPILRIDGRIQRTTLPVLDRETTKRLIYSILTDPQKEKFEKELELDLSLSLPGMDRFRVNVHMQKNSVEGAFRRVPLDVPTMEELGISHVVKELARKPNGLVLVTGPTGVGKTTTLAAMVDLINKERERVCDRLYRRPDRIRACQHQEHHKAKRGVLRYAFIFRRPHAYPQAGPQRHHRRRNARPGNDIYYFDGGRNWPFGPGHAAYT